MISPGCWIAQRRKAAPTPRRLGSLVPGLFLVLCLGRCWLVPAAGQGAEVSFDGANKLYEQGHYLEAAATYQQLVRDNPASATVYFNLGNAYYKAGQQGRALAAYRAAQRLDPRDPSVRFNLRFVREQVSGPGHPGQPFWTRVWAALTLNEWTGLALGAYWLWCILLSLREYRPNLRPALRGYTAAAGAACLLLATGLTLAAYTRYTEKQVVVIVPKAVLRYGPLIESQEAFQLRDGAEVEVLEEKEMTDPSRRETWLQVRDSTGRVGWLRSDQVLRLSPWPQVQPGSVLNLPPAGKS